MSAVDLGLGKATISMKPKDGIFYNILSEICDLDVKCESDLLSLVKELNYARKEYDKVKDALVDVRETGYGLVAPQLSEMKFEEPEMVKHGSKFGVKLKRRLHLYIL